MTHIRIAAIQLSFQPSTRDSMGWRIEEPLSPLDPLVNSKYPDYSLASLKAIAGCREVCGNLMKETNQRYVNNISEKLKEVLNYCYSNDVDLVVLPEYAVPVNAIPSLFLYSTRMTIVCGLGYVRRSDIAHLEDLKFNVEGIDVGNNVAAVLSQDDNNYLITKKDPAQGEGVIVGDGPSINTVRLSSESKQLGVAICLDFPNRKSLFIQDDTDIVAIPALSMNTREFYETPRGFVRVFSNHANFGGTYIGIPDIQGLDYSNSNGTVPLEKGTEGIVIVDWDASQTFVTAPKSLRSTNHKIYAIAGLIYSGREPTLAKHQKRMEQITSDDVLRVEDVLQHASEVLFSLDAKYPEHFWPAKSLNLLLDRQDSVQKDEILSLTRHCTLSEGILTLAELQYLQCIDVVRNLKKLQEHIREPEILANPYAAYERTAREISKGVRANLLEVRHKGPTVINETNQHSQQSQLVIFARLGAYNDESIKSLPRQLTLLRAVADLQDPTIGLHYRIFTEKDPSGMMLAFFDVICTTSSKTQSQIELLRESLGQVIHIAFTGSYNINYTTGDEALFAASENVRQKAKWWTELELSTEVISPYLNIPDWGMVVDLLRSLSDPVVIELQCSALPYATEPRQKTPSVGMLTTERENEKTVNSIFKELLEKEGYDNRRLQLRVFLGSNVELAPSITSSIGIEIAGSNPFSIGEPFLLSDIINRSAIGLPGYSPVLALSIFHPPFGDIYVTANLNREGLRIPTNETVFPSGIVIGKSHVRHVRADREIEIRLSDDDRLKHTYVIGKTGSGKTNLLKLMASQDVQIPGRGVTIIDPHGDLVDHVLRQVPQSRAEEVILIDLTRTDALPVLNPLSLGKNKRDVTIRDRTIQELILLLKSRIYHEYTGPRFEEIVRLTFETMLDDGYPIPASFVEVSGLLMDRQLQKDIESLVVDPELKKRWGFQDTLARDNEYGSVIHYITSKFADISRDSTLRCVMGGATSTLDIEEIVNKGGILLVRIPEAVIGKQAADFIGSLILLQLRMAIIRRREFGKLQHHHFVYVDEFQNFANTDFHTVVAEARKFNIGFTLAHQNLEQLRDFSNHTGTHEQRLINAILGNVGNIIVFGVGAIDAEFISRQIGVSAKEIMKIGRYQALAKILANGYDTNAFTLKMGEAKRLENPRVVELVHERMKMNYWINPQTVYEEISTRLEKISQASKAKRQTGGGSTTKAAASDEDPLKALERLINERKTKASSDDESNDVAEKSKMANLSEQNAVDSLEDIDLFTAMGGEGYSPEEKEAILTTLQEYVMDDFLKYDVQLLVTRSEYEGLLEIVGTNDSKYISAFSEELQESILEYLEKLIPDMEEIILEKALELKLALLKMRFSILRERFEIDSDKLSRLLPAQAEFDRRNYDESITMLNDIQDSNVDIKSALDRIVNR